MFVKLEKSNFFSSQGHIILEKHAKMHKPQFKVREYNLLNISIFIKMHKYLVTRIYRTQVYDIPEDGPLILQQPGNKQCFRMLLTILNRPLVHR